MLVYMLMPFYYLVPFLVLGLIGLWAWQWRLPAGPRREGFRVGLRLLALEELIVAPLPWVAVFATPTSGNRELGPLAAGAYAVCVALAAFLATGRPLPEWCAPLRGRWLRMFLASVALAGLLAVGPWWFLATGSWSVGASPSLSGSVPPLFFYATAFTLPLVLVLYAWVAWLRLVTGLRPSAVGGVLPESAPR
jgi:hypothetical protein